MANVVVVTQSGVVPNLAPSKNPQLALDQLKEGPSFYSLSVTFADVTAETIFLPDGTEVSGATATFDMTAIRTNQQLSAIRGCLFNVNPGERAGTEWGSQVLHGDWLIVTDSGQVYRYGVMKRFGFSTTAEDYCIMPAQVSGACKIVSNFPSKIQFIKLSDSDTLVYGEGNFVLTNYDVDSYAIQTEMGLGV